MTNLFVNRELAEWIQTASFANHTSGSFVVGTPEYSQRTILLQFEVIIAEMSDHVEYYVHLFISEFENALKAL